MIEHQENWFVEVTKNDGSVELVVCDDEEDARILVRRINSLRLGPKAKLIKYIGGVQ